MERIVTRELNMLCLSCGLARLGWVSVIMLLSLELYPVYSDVPVRRSSFSDRVYGTVTVWYGPNRAGTVTVLCLFAGKKEVLGSVPGQSCLFCFFTPIYCACFSS